MDVAAFVIVWIGLGLYAVLAGADFGVGVWVVLSHLAKRGDELRRDAFGYFGPVWEINGLFLVFFLVGLITAFPAALSLLSRALIGLVLAALVMFVFRSGAYALLHHGPDRGRGAATWVFALSSIVAAAGLGYAAVAPVSGFLRDDGLDEGFYTSAPALAALPLTVAATAHLSALVVAAYADVRGRDTTGWYRRAALGAGAVVLPLVVLFTVALASEVPYVEDRLLSARVIPMVGGGVLVFLGTVALWRRRYAAAAVLTFAGYLAGMIGGALAMLPYMIYPALTVEEAAAPGATLAAYLIVTAVGGPLLLAALVAMYHTTLGPGRWGGVRATRGH